MSPYLLGMSTRVRWVWLGSSQLQSEGKSGPKLPLPWEPGGEGAIMCKILKVMTMRKSGGRRKGILHLKPHGCARKAEG